MNYLYERVGETLLIVHPEQGCSDQEWDAWIARMGQRDYRNILVVTDGGGPTVSQRGRAVDFWKGKEVPRFAVVTEEALVRGILTAFRWLKISDMMPVSPNNIAEAFDYIGAPDAERHQLLERIVALKAQLRRRKGASKAEYNNMRLALVDYRDNGRVVFVEAHWEDETGRHMKAGIELPMMQTICQRCRAPAQYDCEHCQGRGHTWKVNDLHPEVAPGTVGHAVLKALFGGQSLTEDEILRIKKNSVW